MGKLFAVSEGFEIKEINPSDRDRVVIDYCKMIFEAEQASDCFFVEDDIYHREFSYGNITDLMYGKWDEIKSDSRFEGISQKAMNLIGQNMFHPFGGRSVSKADFDCETEPKCYNGFDNGCENLQLPCVYVKCIASWYAWRRKWFQDNPHLIDWSQAEESFLPCPKAINSILKRELMQHGINPENIARKELVFQFEKKVLSHKARNGMREAYIRQIGEEICLANFYKFEPEISTFNQQQKKSLRAIYSIRNKEGKKQYISLDFEKGMFEYHNEHGDHLGEYHFEGTSNKKAEPDHRLLLLS